MQAGRQAAGTDLLWDLPISNPPPKGTPHTMEVPPHQLMLHKDELTDPPRFLFEVTLSHGERASMKPGTLCQHIRGREWIGNQTGH